MNQRDMFLKSFQRPTNYFQLNARRQWEIDAELGILDMDSQDWSPADMQRYKAHYQTA